jgi:hypothetical protein
MSDVECPYCEAEQEICHDDGYGYTEGEIYQQECSSCGKVFIFTTSISFNYDAERADCLNGGEHIYKRTITAPRWAARDRCEVCGDEKPIPEEERKRLYAEANDH